MTDWSQFTPVDTPPQPAPSHAPAVDWSQFTPVDAPAEATPAPGTFAADHPMLSKIEDLVENPSKAVGAIKAGLGASGDQSYGSGLGYLLDNPVTRGLAQAADKSAAGVNELAGRVFVAPVDYFRPGTLEAYRQAMVYPAQRAADAEAAPVTGGLGNAAMQFLSSLGGQISIGGATGGGGEAAPATEAVQPLSKLIADAVSSQPARMAGAIGAQAGGSQIAEKEAAGQPVSNAQAAQIVTANTAANLVPTGSTLPLLARAPVSVAANVAGNELVNQSLGQAPGTGDAQAGVLGLLLSLLPHGAAARTIADASPTAAKPDAAGSAPIEPPTTPTTAVESALRKAGLTQAQIDAAKAPTSAPVEKPEPLPKTTTDAVQAAVDAGPSKAPPAPPAAAAANAAADNRVPGQPLHPWTPVDDSVSVPYAGGVSTDGRTVYLDKRMPQTVSVDGKTIDAHEAVALHERVEWPLMHEQGMSYQEAHAIATAAENRFVQQKYGVDPDKYQAALHDAIGKAREQAPDAPDVPGNLDAKPYIDGGDADLLEPPPHEPERASAAPISPEKHAAYYNGLRNEIGWAERGGKIIRTDDGSYLGAVTNRTKWVPKMGGDNQPSSFWRMRPDRNLTEAQAHTAFDKDVAGQPLRPIEQRFVDYAHQTADEYAQTEAEETARFEADERDMDDESRAQAAQALRERGAEVAPDDEHEALTLAQWAERAHDAGVDGNDIHWAATAPIHAERFQRFAQLIAEKAHGPDAQASPVGGERGDSAPQGRVVAAGADLRSQVGEGADRENAGAAPAQAARSETAESRSAGQVAPRGGLFAAPTAHERIRATAEAKDATRNGVTGGRADTGEGGLFDGERPEQTDLAGSRLSRAAAPATHSLDQVRTTLRKSPLGRAFAQLESSGALRIESHPDADWSGYWDGDKAVLNAARAGEEGWLGTAMHELGGHGSLRDMLGAEGFARAVRDIRALANEKGVQGDVVRRAMRRVEFAGTRPEHADEELLAYTISEAVREGNAWKSGGLNTALVRIFNRIRAWVKTSAIGKLLDKRGVEWQLNPTDISALAESGVRRMAREAGAERGREPLAQPVHSQPGKLDFGGRSDEELDAEYDRLAGTDNGRRLDTDQARELNPEYRADRSRAQDVHDAASDYIKDRYRRLLAGPVARGRKGIVNFLAGGAGSGKSTVSRSLLGPSDADITYDGTLSNYDRAKREVDAALASGRDVHITHASQDPGTAARLTVERTIKKGRVVPVEHFANGHAMAPEVVRRLAQEYDGNPRVTFSAIDNRGPIDAAHLISGEDIPHVERAHAEAVYRSALDQARASGRLSEKDYQAALGVDRSQESSRVGEATTGFAEGRGEARDRHAVNGESKPDIRYSHAATADGEHFDAGSGEEEELPRAELPARAPGESQQAWHARVMRENRGDMKDGMQTFAATTREQGRGLIRATLADLHQRIAEADRAFHAAQTVFDKAGEKANLAAIDQWERGEEVASAPHRLFFKAMADAFDQRIAAIRDINPDSMKDLIANYFPHLWENPKKAGGVIAGIMQKRNLTGDKSFLKQRYWPTIKEGMASGLKPISTNPVDLVLGKLAQMDKFIAFNRMMQDMDGRGWIKKVPAGEQRPENYAFVDDPAFRAQHAVIVKGAEGEPDSARTLHWNYAVPEGVATDLNRYLSPGLYQFKGWRAFRGVQNLLLSARLGFSAFHAGFTTADTLVSHLDVAMRRALTGDAAGAAETLARTVASPILAPLEGRRLFKQFYGEAASDENTAAVLNALKEGGARGLMNPTDENNSFNKAIRAARQGRLGKTALHALPATVEATTRLISHHLVPYQKMSARALLMKYELDRVAGDLGQQRGDYAKIVAAMDPDALRQIAGRVVQNVDDRLGQMAYDNLFWHRGVKDIAQATIQSVGWNIGTFNTIVGAAGDVRRVFNPEKLVAPLDKAGTITDARLSRVSGRLSYLVSLNLGIGLASGVTQYLLTGQGPQSLKDYFYPRTGRKSQDGTDERLSWPTYLKDEYALATHPIQTIEHKVHPVFSMALELLNNQDFYGTKIHNPDDPWAVQAKQVAEYLVGGFKPYAVQNQAHVAQAGGDLADRALPFVGVTPAPADVSRSPFQSFIAEKAGASSPSEARTPEQAQQSTVMHAAENAVRHHQPPDMTGLSPLQRREVFKTAQQEVPQIRFRRLGIEDKLRAYDLATPEEREQYDLRGLILRGRWQESVQHLPEADRADVLDQLRSLRRGNAAPESP